MYFTDRGIEELADRRGDQTVSIDWLAERLRQFVDLNPEFETPIDRLATWLARDDDLDDSSDDDLDARARSDEDVEAGLNEGSQAELVEGRGTSGSA